VRAVSTNVAPPRLLFGLPLDAGVDASKNPPFWTDATKIREEPGFLFIDMLANRAGILFASSATSNQASAQEMQRLLRGNLTSSDFEGLPEGIYREEFQSEFGGLGGTKTRGIDGEITLRLKTSKANQDRTR